MNLHKFVSLVLALSIASCRSVSSQPQSSLRSDISEGNYLQQIASLDEFNRLALPNKISYPFIKFSHFYAFPSSDPLFDGIYYQNTKTFEFHYEFLANTFPRYKNVNNYEDLILPPKGGEAGSSIKEITAGAMYYRPKSHPEGELLAYQIYFREDLSSTTQKTLVDLEEVARFDRKLKSTVAFVPADKIVYMLNHKADLFAWRSKLSAKGVSIVERRKFEVPPSGATTYVKASSYGYLRAISMTEFEAGNYSEKDILVFKNIPLDVGPIAGVITEVPAAAHSHVMFRAQNLNVPGIYIPNATIEPLIAGNINRLVKFSANEDNSYSIVNEGQNPSIKAEAEAYWKARRKVLETPVADLSVKTLKLWAKDGVKPSDILVFGAKATNFAILDTALVKAGVERDRYSNGFMVPFSFFDKHMEATLSTKLCADAEKKCEKAFGSPCTKAVAMCNVQGTGSTLRSYVMAMIAPANRAEMNANPQHRRQFLEFTQRLIREAPLAEGSLEAVRLAMTAYPNTVRMRLRSSTNAEDIEGLNGAGLYESKSACLGDDEKAKDDDGKLSACRTPYEVTRMTEQAAKLRSFEDTDGKLKALADEIEADISKKYPLSKAIRSVYASLWTERSFLTREFYGLKHEGIYMGMLSHPSFVDESVNGVAVITFENNEPIGLKLEAQYEDISVTNPIFPNTIPELWAASIKGDLLSDQRIVTPSTLSKNGQTVLSAAELSELGRQLVIAAKALRAVRGGNRYDLEFILDKNRTILIKQGRPL